MNKTLIYLYTSISLVLFAFFSNVSTVFAQSCTGNIRCDTFYGGSVCDSPWYSVSCALKGCGAECKKPLCQFAGSCKSSDGGGSECGSSSAGSCQGGNVGDSCGNGGTCKNPPNCSCQGQGGGGGGGTPSCSTVDLTPDTFTFSVGSTQNFIAGDIMTSNGSVDKVEFESGDIGIVTVNPGSDSEAVYNTEAKGEAVGQTTITADVFMEGVGGPQCTDTSTVTITNPGPWWQARDADLITNGNITSTIPATCSGACTPNLILDGGGGYPGVALYGGSLSIGSSGTLSSTNWRANTTFNDKRIYNYALLAKQIPSDVVFNEITTASITGETLSQGGKLSRGFYWYHFDGALGDLTITSNANVAERKVILLVEGADLNIKKRINLIDGTGFFMAIVGKDSSGGKGDIFVDGSITHPVNPELEGIFLADGQFSTGTLGPGSDSQLHIRGSVAAYGGINLQRDLTDNSNTPAEYFEFAPELTLLYPSKLKIQRFRWEEVAP